MTRGLVAMPAYLYRALSESGAMLKGESIAASADELAGDLARQGLLVELVRPKRSGWTPFASVRIKPDSLALFNHEFMALVRAGLTVPEALSLSAERRDSTGFTRILKRILEEVHNGVQLSEACARHPEAFDNLYVSAVQTGERTGNLAGVLAGFQEDLKLRLALQRKISQAMAYPAFLLVTLVVILGLLFVFVMPRFLEIYADFEARLPLPTRLLLSVVDNLPLYGLLIAAAGFAGWFAFKLWIRTEKGRLRAGWLKLRLPLYGAVHRRSIVAQLARMLSTLLAAGTPLTEALRAAHSTLGNYEFARRVARAGQQVSEGQSLARAFRNEGVMPETAVKLIEVGEASGSLDEMLREVAQYFEEILEHDMARLMALIEPALMLLIGIMVGGIILIMYLPIFNIAEIIK